MICDNLSKSLGFDCSPVTEAGNIVLVSTPFRFDDGDTVPVFAEQIGEVTRFFDDGQTLMHFIGRGMRLDNAKNTRFLRNAAKEHGANFTDDGEIEMWASASDTSHAFGCFMKSLLQIVAWEREQRGSATDETEFVEQVAMALRAWKPQAPLTEGPVFEGVSGKNYALDFSFDGDGVIATSPHPNAASSALHKLVDIHGLLANESSKFLVVIDDRFDPDAATREAKVMQVVATVIPFTALESKVGAYAVQ